MSTDYIADYLAARIERERATCLDEQFAAEDKARAIDQAADAAGVWIPAGIVEAARVAVHGLTKIEREDGVIGYDHRTGLPLFSD